MERKMVNGQKQNSVVSHTKNVESDKNDTPESTF